MKKLLLIHGANLNNLGKRDPRHYSYHSLREIEELTATQAAQYDIEVIAYQSNHEGDLIDKIQEESPNCMGIIINPGAFTHYSYALHDALLDSKLPVVEVHLSCISEREDWRKISVTAPACIAVIEGKQAAGYQEAVHKLLNQPLTDFKMPVSSETQLNLVIGYPLNHSKSPLLHNTLYSKLNINATLKALPYPHLDALVQTIKALSVGLTAVTMPFKTDILDFLDECSEEALSLKAVNTVIQKDSRLYGYNTDVDGIRYALRKIALKDKRVLIVGAGGAAMAAGYCVKQAGANLFWINRTLEKAEQLARRFGGELTDLKRVQEIPMDLIIQTTPQGLYPNVHEYPLPDYPFQPQQTLFDMIYNPVETQWMKKAKEKGAQTISGVEMFIGQGIRQVELWTGKTLLTENLAQLLRTLLTSKENTL